MLHNLPSPESRPLPNGFPYSSFLPYAYFRHSRPPDPTRWLSWKIQAPTAFQRIMVTVSRTRPDGMRSRCLIANHRLLLLIEITLTHTIRPLSADVPTGTLMLLCQQEIDMAGKPRTSLEIHHPAQSSLGMLLRDNIDNAHVAFRIMLGGGRRDNL